MWFVREDITGEDKILFMTETLTVKISIKALMLA